MNKGQKFVINIIVLLTVGYVGAIIGYNQAQQATSQSKTGQTSSASVKPLNEMEIFNLVNKQRTDNGLPALAYNEKLHASALAKCNDMATRNYWEHDTPDGVEPWQFIKNAGLNYAYASENLAYGFENDASVVSGWMESPSHKANILQIAIDQSAVAVCDATDYQGNHNTQIIVQHFIKAV